MIANFNQCADKFLTICPFFKSKVYFSVENNAVKINSFGFFRRLCRRLGGYHSTRQNEFVKQVYPLTLSKNAIPENYKEAIRNLLKEHYFSYLYSSFYFAGRVSEQVELINGEEVKIIQSFDYYGNIESYKDEKGNIIIPSRDKVEGVTGNIRFTWNFQPGGSFDLNISKVNENIFTFSWDIFHHTNPQEAGKEKWIKWAFDQSKKILTTLKLELGRSDVGIFYILKQPLEANLEHDSELESIDKFGLSLEQVFLEQTPMQKNLNRLGLQFEQKIYDQEEQVAYLYSFRETDMTFEKTNNISLAFNLGFESACHYRVKSARKN